MELQKALKDLDKRFGEGKVFRLGDNKTLDVEALSTGFIALDEALGVGGLPKGRIVEIWGWDQAGKTTLCQHLIAEAQKAGIICAMVDVEHSLSKSWAATCGVDTENLYISQSDSGEEAMDVTEAMVKSGVFGMIVVDSTNALVSRAEIEGEHGQAHMGLQARLMSQALRKLNGPVKENNVILIFISQIRNSIGGWGDNKVIGTGNALKFWASVRMELSRIQTITEADVAIGNKVKIKIKKNKVAAPFKECELRLYFDSGFSKAADLLLYAIENGVVEKRGSWFRYNDEAIAQGETNAVSKLKADNELYGKIMNDVKALKNE